MNNMRDEIQKAYKALRRDQTSPMHAEEIFEAGWKASSLRSDAAQSKRNTQDGTFFIDQFKADRALSRAKIMDKAVDAFRNGLDERARLYRELALEIFGKQL